MLSAPSGKASVTALLNNANDANTAPNNSIAVVADHPSLHYTPTSTASSSPAPSNNMSRPATVPSPPPSSATTPTPTPAKKKHICLTCKKGFTTSGHLARHTRVHTGERNHKCPFPGCETRCSRQDNLQQHYRIHLSPGSRRSSSSATRAAIARAMEQVPHNQQQQSQQQQAQQQQHSGPPSILTPANVPNPLNSSMVAGGAHQHHPHHHQSNHHSSSHHQQSPLSLSGNSGSAGSTRSLSSVSLNGSPEEKAGILNGTHGLNGSGPGGAYQNSSNALGLQSVPGPNYHQQYYSNGSVSDLRSPITPSTAGPNGPQSANGQSLANGSPISPSLSESSSHSLSHSSSNNSNGMNGNRPSYSLEPRYSPPPILPPIHTNGGGNPPQYTSYHRTHTPQTSYSHPYFSPHANGNGTLQHSPVSPPLNHPVPPSWKDGLGGYFNGNHHGGHSGNGSSNGSPVNGTPLMGHHHGFGGGHGMGAMLTTGPVGGMQSIAAGDVYRRK